MTTYVIGYDLNSEGAAYSATNKALIDKIKSMFSAYWHHLDSTWLVVSSMTAVDIRNALLPCLDQNDELLVLEAGHIAAWKGFDEKAANWLKSNL